MRSATAEVRGNPEASAVRPDLAWLIAVGATCCLTAYTAVGLVLAMLGRFSTAPTLAITGAAALVVLIAVGPHRIAAHAPRGHAQVWSIVAAVTLLAIALWIGNDAGQHIITVRDPGSYLTTARWLARDGSLNPDVTSPLLDQIAGIDYAGPAIYGAGNGRVEFQFTHGSSTVMAGAFDLGGTRALFGITALVAALGLFSLFTLLRQVRVSPPLALAATAALAISAPMLFVTRATYSEPYAFAALWAGILVLSSGAARQAGWAFVAGWLIGSGVLYRIDATMYVIAMLVTLTVLVVRRCATTGVLIASAAGAVVPATVGLLDQRYFAGNYARHLAPETRLLSLATGGSAALLIGAQVAMRRVRGTVGDLGNRAAAVVCGIVAVALSGLWLLRPHIQKARADWDEDSPYAAAIAAIQRREGAPVEPLRSYGEYSVKQVQWYFGAALLVLAIGGFAYITYQFLRRRDSPWNVVAPFIAVGAPLYLWSPSITPDQLWATRRFMPFVFPAFALAAAVGASRLVDRVRTSALRCGSTIVVSAAIVLPTLSATWPVRAMADGRGSLQGIEQTCAAIDGAPLGLAARQSYASMALRSWCGVTVGSLNASEWERGVADFLHVTDGRCIATFLISGDPADFAPFTSSIDSTVDIELVVGPTATPTLDRPVDRLADQRFHLAVARIPARC